MRFLRFILVSFFLIAAFWVNDTKALPKDFLFISNSKFFDFTTPETDNDKFTLFVNQGILHIKYGKPQELLNGEVILYNLLGQEVTRKKLEVTLINQVVLPPQSTCYIIRIIYSGKVYTQKVIVKTD